jgi:hypothetical protein
MRYSVRTLCAETVCELRCLSFFLVVITVGLLAVTAQSPLDAYDNFSTSEPREPPFDSVDYSLFAFQIIYLVAVFIPLVYSYKPVPLWSCCCCTRIRSAVETKIDNGQTTDTTTTATTNSASPQLIGRVETAAITATTTNTAQPIAITSGRISAAATPDRTLSSSLHRESEPPPPPPPLRASDAIDPDFVAIELHASTTAPVRSSAPVAPVRSTTARKHRRTRAADAERLRHVPLLLQMYSSARTIDVVAEEQTRAAALNGVSLDSLDA